MRKSALSVFRSAALSALLVLSSLTSLAANDSRFPMGPDSQLTPGELCTRPSAYRYPEHIPYCNRNVDSSLKRDIIATYDSSRGYNIRKMDRMQFKIDHYIPLCMGGSNDRDNLWPQHRTVYELTDPMEGIACEKMQEGVLKQAKAVELIKKAKNDLSKVPEVMAYLNSL